MLRGPIVVAILFVLAGCAGAAQKKSTEAQLREVPAAEVDEEQMLKELELHLRKALGEKNAEAAFAKSSDTLALWYKGIPYEQYSYELSVDGRCWRRKYTAYLESKDGFKLTMRIMNSSKSLPRIRKSDWTLKGNAFSTTDFPVQWKKSLWIEATMYYGAQADQDFTESILSAISAYAKERK